VPSEARSNVRGHVVRLLTGFHAVRCGGHELAVHPREFNEVRPSHQRCAMTGDHGVDVLDGRKRLLERLQMAEDRWPDAATGRSHSWQRLVPRPGLGWPRAPRRLHSCSATTRESCCHRCHPPANHPRVETSRHEDAARRVQGPTTRMLKRSAQGAERDDVPGHFLVPSPELVIGGEARSRKLAAVRICSG